MTASPCSDAEAPFVQCNEASLSSSSTTTILSCDLPANVRDHRDQATMTMTITTSPSPNESSSSLQSYSDQHSPCVQPKIYQSKGTNTQIMAPIIRVMRMVFNCAKHDNSIRLCQFRFNLKRTEKCSLVFHQKKAATTV